MKKEEYDDDQKRTRYLKQTLFLRGKYIITPIGMSSLLEASKFEKHSILSISGALLTRACSDAIVAGVCNFASVSGINLILSIFFLTNQLLSLLFVFGDSIFYFESINKKNGRVVVCGRVVRDCRCILHLQV